MAYTFGGATGDDANITLNSAMGANSRIGFVAGWWLPTTLTATRGLWSAGNTFGAEIDGTTSSLRLRTDNTTDGQWTVPVGLTQNQWRFLAFLSSTNNSGPSAAWRVWSGTIDTAPTECTVTQAVAPSGNFTGNATFYVGNKGTGTLAFQGDIDGILYYNATGSGGTANDAIGVSAFGAITDAEAEFAYRRFVLPIWAGEQWDSLAAPFTFQSANVHEWGFIPFNIARVSARKLPVITLSATAPYNAMTINGAAISANGCARPFRPQGMLYANPVF